MALVGPTGSGKTSTMALAHRFYDAWSGSVRIGGEDVRDLSQESLGRAIAMVLQEPFLFTGSVFDNIRYTTVEATREKVEQAARAVGAHDFILRLPNGYDTELEQRGANSLGQRQLISFARALVADAPILILDEAGECGQLYGTTNPTGAGRVAQRKNRDGDRASFSDNSRC